MHLFRKLLNLILLSVCSVGCVSNTITDFFFDTDSGNTLVSYQPLVFVSRHISSNSVSAAYNIHRPEAFYPGSELMLKSVGVPAIEATSLTARLFPNETGTPSYEVKDLSVSIDGNILLFALKTPSSTWNIWKYNKNSDEISRIISEDSIANSGNDVSPLMLANGSIVFSSDRQVGFRQKLSAEGRAPYYAINSQGGRVFNLHKMSASGGNIEQLTLHSENDLYPSLLPNGKIVFSRWNIDTSVSPAQTIVSLYQMFQDGTQLETLYGFNSNELDPDANDNTRDVFHIGLSRGAFIRPKSFSNGLLTSTFYSHESQTSYDAAFLAINSQFFSDRFAPINSSITTLGDGLLLPIGYVPNDGRYALGSDFSLLGRFASVTPLMDGTFRAIASWSACRINNQDNQVIALESGASHLPCTAAYYRLASQKGLSNIESDPLYSIWIYDFNLGTKRLMHQGSEGRIPLESSIMVARVPTPALTGTIESEVLRELNLGLFSIRSVWDVDGIDRSVNGIARMADPAVTNFSERSPVFARFVEKILEPNASTPSFNANNKGRAEGFYRILGYSTIEPDGSLRVAVPANVNFKIQLLDQSGAFISDHPSVFSLKPGTSVSCSGCHDPSNNTSNHGRSEFDQSVYSGAQGGQNFPNTLTTIIPQRGETMAEARSRVEGLPLLSPFIEYEDDWTDVTLAGRSPDANVTYNYTGLAESPIESCVSDDWTHDCRIILNYEDHIHPLWQKTRLITIGGVSTDVTCSTCHSSSLGGVTQVPEEQLDLSLSVSDQYAELFYENAAQELQSGLLVDKVIPFYQNGVYLYDVIETTRPVLSPLGSNESPFFTEFSSTGTHQGYMTSNELHILREWLDIGGQLSNEMP